MFTCSQKSYYFLKKLALDYILSWIWLIRTEKARNDREEEISFFFVPDYDIKFKLSFISKNKAWVFLIFIYSQASYVDLLKKQGEVHLNACLSMAVIEYIYKYVNINIYIYLYIIYISYVRVYT